MPRIPQAGTSPSCGQHVPSLCSGEPPNDEGNDTESETIIVRSLLSPTHGHLYSPHSTPLERPLEMEQILTEDGEPMLNPGQSVLSVVVSSLTFFLHQPSY